MAGLMEYKCPCCGGAIEFDSESQKMKCPFCDTEFETETLRSYDEELKSDRDDRMDWVSASEAGWSEAEQAGMRVYVCDSCGGSILCEETTAATECPYCGNPVVMKGQVAGTLRPDLVIPFKLNKEQAKEGLKRHLQGKRLLPKVFSNENHIDEIKGIYVPFWLFDADAEADMRFRATKVRMWSDARYNYTQTSYFSVSRSGTLSFERIPVDGSKKADDALMESLEPYDFRAAVDFQTAYLSGYLADKYDVTGETCSVRANERAKISTEQAFAETVKGYSSVTREAGSVRLKNGTIRYALLPVWLLNTTRNGQKYTFAMNGQTGKFVGDLPVDKGAYARWLIGLTGAIGAGLFLLSLLVL